MKPEILIDDDAVDRDLVQAMAIALRAYDEARKSGVKWSIDDVDRIYRFIVMCHQHACELRLDDLFAADTFNFMHDVAGIDAHMTFDPEPRLTNHFLPRFAASTSEAA